ncbi:MAG: mechanosensitive ion channel [Armatimonadetes bacterium]|nr:mechanosensitive ion channel [Armatimonadota bacterium]
MISTFTVATLVVKQEWLRAGGIMLAFLLGWVIIAVVGKKVFKKLVARTNSQLDDIILSALHGLAQWAIIIAGAYFAFREVTAAEPETTIWTIIGKGFTIAWVGLAIASAIRIFNAYSQWKIEQTLETHADVLRDVATRVNFFRKLLIAVVAIIGGLYILSIAGIDTSPIVAGGAVGGIVIGIALQDTLSNVFAGFFLNIDRPVKIGDFIRLDSGQEGFVEEVGWRYTKIRLYANNLVIIPNNKLSQSTITNFNLPSGPLSVYMTCGVSYDSDLEHVEEVAIRVARQVLETEPGGDTQWDPVVRFKEFGDSSINFTTVLRALDVDSQYRIQHQFVKQLHRAFNEEGIEIPFPIRTVIMKNGDQEAEVRKP